MTQQLNSIYGHSNSEQTAKLFNWDKLLQITEQLTENSDLAYRNYILIGLFYGLRCADIRNLKYKDLLELDTSDNFIVEVKTEKKFKLFPHAYIVNYFKKVYNTYNVIQENSYICAKIGKKNPLSLTAINDKIKKLAIEHQLLPSGNSKGASTHSIRKTFARKFYVNGGANHESIEALSMYLNHSSTTMTRIYIGILDEKIYNVLNNFHNE